MSVPLKVLVSPILRDKRYPCFDVPALLIEEGGLIHYLWQQPTGLVDWFMLIVLGPWTCRVHNVVYGYPVERIREQLRHHRAVIRFPDGDAYLLEGRCTRELPLGVSAPILSTRPTILPIPATPPRRPVLRLIHSDPGTGSKDEAIDPEHRDDERTLLAEQLRRDRVKNRRRRGKSSHRPRGRLAGGRSS